MDVAGGSPTPGTPLKAIFWGNFTSDSCIWRPASRSSPPPCQQAFNINCRLWDFATLAWHILRSMMATLLDVKPSCFYLIVPHEPRTHAWWEEGSKVHKFTYRQSAAMGNGCLGGSGWGTVFFLLFSGAVSLSFLALSWGRTAGTDYLHFWG